MVFGRIRPDAPGCARANIRERKARGADSCPSPRGLLCLQEFLPGFLPTPTPIPPPDSLPSTLLAGPAGWLAHSAHGSLPPPPQPAPPPSRPSAGREPACLSRPIYHQHGNNPRESAGPRPGPPARTAPDGQNPGSVTATAGRRGKPPGSSRPERPARVLPGPGPSSSRQAGCRAAGTARRAGQSYFYLV